MNLRHRLSSRSLLLSLACIGLAAGCAGGAGTAVTTAAATKTYGATIDNGSVGTPPANGKTLLAIYMIGSNLEDDLKPRDDVSDETEAGGIVKTGSGSSNLRQLLAGYAGLSDAEKGNVDILLGMGGSRKQGWQGIKDMDLPTLLNDSKDDYFGNDGPFSFSDPAADMSDDKTFQAFLLRVKARAPGAGKVMLELWDHGGAYLGIGPDTNHATGPSSGQLYLDHIKTDLDATQFKGDIIGFDACLMGNLEVAEALKDHFSYLVGSEETEPAHGWDYSLIVNEMGKVPMASALDFAKKIVDIYIESPANQASKGRTLGVLDLSKTAPVTAAMDGLTTALGGNLAPDFQAVLRAAGTSQHYGREGDAGSEFSLDLKDFTAKVSPSLGTDAPAAAVESAVQGMVAYSRESGEKPNSNGLSVFSPVNVTFFNGGYYYDKVAVSTTWFSYLGTFVSKGLAASAGPSVSGETAVTSAYRTLMDLSAPALGQVPDGSYKMSIKADPGVSHVSAMHVVQADPSKNRYTVVSSDRVDAAADGSYTLDGWDGTAIYLTDAKGASVQTPFTFDTLTATGTSVYVAPARVDNQEATVYLEWDKAKGAAVGQWVRPFTPASGKLPVQMSKLQSDLVAGDTVAFYYSTIDTDADAKTATLSTPVTLGSAPIWVQKQVPGQKLYFLFAQDLKGDVTASPLHLVVDLLGGLGL